MTTKDDFQERLQAQIREWDAQIELLKARADRAKTDQKMAYRKEIDKLKARQQDLRQKLGEMQTSSEGAWEEIKSGTESAWKELDASFRKAMEHFR
jgi:predicted  nucleic acid-binding Zn-ribbon protein